MHCIAHPTKVCDPRFTSHSQRSRAAHYVTSLLIGQKVRKGSETALTRYALIYDLAVVGEAVTAVHPADIHCDAAARSTDARVGQARAQFRRHRLDTVTHYVPAHTLDLVATPLAVAAMQRRSAAAALERLDDQQHLVVGAGVEVET